MARRRARHRPARSLTLLAAAALLVGVGYYLGLRAERLGRQPAATKSAPPSPRAARPRAARPHPPEAPVPPRPAPSAAGRLAIVIDDLGRSTADVDRLLALGVPLTYAVLPFESRTAEVVARLREAGVEILCHLPMESSGGANPGPNAIRERQSPERVGELTRAALDALPGAAGVNNHMGSAITADPIATGAVLDAVAERDLFFLDSRTTKESVAFDLARRRAIPAAKRDVFLDEEPAARAVDRAFDQLLALARERGAAIAIGHPHEATFRVLERRIPEARAAGFELVPVSFLLERDESVP